MDDKQAFYVESTDGRKFKMVIRGELGKLSVAKIRRYLKSYGVPDNQQVLAGNLVLEDDMLGEHFGLQNEGVLHLRDPHSSLSTAAAVNPPRVASPPMAPGSRNSIPNQPEASPHLSMSASPNHMTAALRNAAGQQQPPRRPDSTDGVPPAPPQRDVAALQQQLRDLQCSLEEAETKNASLERQLVNARGTSPGAQPFASSSSANPAAEDGLANAKASLALLSEKVHVALQFDRNLTCVVGTDEDFSLLLTYDPATERLYLYSTLLTALPADPAVRAKLYEILLEGSLLGREVCGGGIGVSAKNNVVVLTTSLPVRYCRPEALCDVMPGFVETLGRWRDLVEELVR